MTLHLSDSLYDPEFVMERYPERRISPLTGADVLWVVEVSMTSRTYDLGEKKLVYAENGVEHYWVVDLVKRGVWTFSQPSGGEYEVGLFHGEEAGEVAIPRVAAGLPITPLFSSLVSE